MAIRALSLKEPVVPDRADIEQARTAFEALKHGGISDQLTVEDSARLIHAVLPVAAVRLLQELLREMAQGHAITVVPVHAELTTQQAADALNVSRPFLVKLLQAGDLPFRMVGTHRRIRFEDLMRYRRELDQKRLETLNELTRESRESGLYD